MKRKSGLAASIALTLLISGCAASNPAAPPGASSPLPAAAGGSAPAPANGLKMSRLDRLWEARRSGSGDFPIGPGDVISVFVPGLPDLSRGGAPEAGQTTGVIGGST